MIDIFEIPTLPTYSLQTSSPTSGGLWPLAARLRLGLCLVWARGSGAYLFFLHVQCCVIVGWCGLVGLSFLDMTTLHFSLISLVDLPLLAIFCYMVSYGDGGCRCKYFGALFVGIVDTGLGWMRGGSMSRVLFMSWL